MPGKHPSVEWVRVTKAWAKMLGGDPVPWLLGSNEPGARWVTLTSVLDRARRILMCWRRWPGRGRYSHPGAGRASAGLDFGDTAVRAREPSVRAPPAQLARRHGYTGR